jgi:hypothetical protein
MPQMFSAAAAITKREIAVQFGGMLFVQPFPFLRFSFMTLKRIIGIALCCAVSLGDPVWASGIHVSMNRSTRALEHRSDVFSPVPRFIGSPVRSFEEQTVVPRLSCAYRAGASTLSGFRILRAMLSNQASETPLSLHEALRHARRFVGIDFVQGFHKPANPFALWSYVNLMGSNFEELFENFRNLDYDAPGYRETAAALRLNQDLSRYSELLELYADLKEKNPEDPRLADLRGILRHKQYNGILAKEGDRKPGRRGGIPINRRTWDGRGDETCGLIIDEILRLHKEAPDKTIIIDDWAVSDGITSMGLARRIEENDLSSFVSIRAYDKSLSFWISDKMLDGYRLIFDASGHLIQAVPVNPGRLWVRWTLADYFSKWVRDKLERWMSTRGNTLVGRERFPVRNIPIETLEKRFMQAKAQEDGSLVRISLLDPEVEAYSRAHPRLLQFFEADIRQPPFRGNPDEQASVIRVMGLMMRNKEYFSDSTIKRTLANLAGNSFPEQEGMMLNGVVGSIKKPEQLFLDVYRFNGESLNLEDSRGYKTDRGWEQIYLSEFPHELPRDGGVSGSASGASVGNNRQKRRSGASMFTSLAGHRQVILIAGVLLLLLVMVSFPLAAHSLAATALHPAVHHIAPVAQQGVDHVMHGAQMFSVPGINGLPTVTDYDKINPGYINHLVQNLVNGTDGFSLHRDLLTQTLHHQPDNQELVDYVRHLHMLRVDVSHAGPQPIHDLAQKVLIMDHQIYQPGQAIPNFSGKEIEAMTEVIKTANPHGIMGNQVWIPEFFKPHLDVVTDPKMVDWHSFSCLPLHPVSPGHQGFPFSSHFPNLHQAPAAPAHLVAPAPATTVPPAQTPPVAPAPVHPVAPAPAPGVQPAAPPALPSPQASTHPPIVPYAAKDLDSYVPYPLQLILKEIMEGGFGLAALIVSLRWILRVPRITPVPPPGSPEEGLMKQDRRMLRIYGVLEDMGQDNRKALNLEDIYIKLNPSHTSELSRKEKRHLNRMIGRIQKRIKAKQNNQPNASAPLPVFLSLSFYGVSYSAWLAVPVCIAGGLWLWNDRKEKRYGQAIDAYLGKPGKPEEIETAISKGSLIDPLPVREVDAQVSNLINRTALIAGGSAVLICLAFLLAPAWAGVEHQLQQSVPNFLSIFVGGGTGYLLFHKNLRDPSKNRPYIYSELTNRKYDDRYKLAIGGSFVMFVLGSSIHFAYLWLELLGAFVIGFGYIWYHYWTGIPAEEMKRPKNTELEEWEQLLTEGLTRNDDPVIFSAHTLDNLFNRLIPILAVKAFEPTIIGNPGRITVFNRFHEELMYLAEDTLHKLDQLPAPGTDQEKSRLQLTRLRTVQILKYAVASRMVGDHAFAAANLAGYKFVRRFGRIGGAKGIYLSDLVQGVALAWLRIEQGRKITKSKLAVSVFKMGKAGNEMLPGLFPRIPQFGAASPIELEQEDMEDYELSKAAVEAVDKLIANLPDMYSGDQVQKSHRQIYGRAAGLLGFVLLVISVCMSPNGSAFALLRLWTSIITFPIAVYWITHWQAAFEARREFVTSRINELESKSYKDLPARASTEDAAQKMFLEQILASATPDSDPNRPFSLDLIVIVVRDEATRNALEARLNAMQDQLGLPESQRLPVYFLTSQTTMVADMLQAHSYLLKKWADVQEAIRNQHGYEIPALKDSRIGVLIASGLAEQPFDPLIRTGIVLRTGDAKASFGFDMPSNEQLISGAFNVLNLLYHAQAFKDKGQRAYLVDNAHSIYIAPRYEIDDQNRAPVRLGIYTAHVSKQDIEDANSRERNKKDLLGIAGIDIAVPRYAHSGTGNDDSEVLQGLYAGPNGLRRAQQDMKSGQYADIQDVRQYLGATGLTVMAAESALEQISFEGQMMDPYEVSLILLDRIADKAIELARSMPEQARMFTFKIRAHLLVALIMARDRRRLDGFVGQSLRELEQLMATPNAALPDQRNDISANVPDPLKDAQEALRKYFDFLFELREAAGKLIDFETIIPSHDYFRLLYPDGGTIAHEDLARISKAPALSGKVTSPGALKAAA